MVAIAESVPKPASRFRFIFDRRDVLGSLMVAPAILFVLLLVGVPFLMAVYYSLSAYTIYDPSWSFVGLSNFQDIIEDPVFRQTLYNTFIFTFGSQILGLILGKFGALLLLRPFPGRKLVRALIILPWVVPVALATVDGAGFWRRNYQIIMPMILPIMTIGLVFGIVFTFTDLSIVFLMTQGGPIGETSVLGFAGFQTGIVSGDVSHGEAISLFMLPLLLVVVVTMLRFIRRREI